MELMGQAAAQMVLGVRRIEAGTPQLVGHERNQEEPEAEHGSTDADSPTPPLGHWGSVGGGFGLIRSLRQGDSAS